MGISTSNANAQYNSFTNNTIVSTGKNGINFAYTGGTGDVISNEVSGNVLIGCGVGGVAVGPPDRTSIQLGAGVLGKMNFCRIIANTIIGAGIFTVNPPLYAIGFDTFMTPGSTIVTGNNQTSCVNGDAIWQDIQAFNLLGGNWGSTATVSTPALSLLGGKVTVGVTSTGVGQAVDAGLQLIKVSVPTFTPKPACRIAAANLVTAANASFPFFTSLDFASDMQFIYKGTPDATDVYSLVIDVE